MNCDTLCICRNLWSEKSLNMVSYGLCDVMHIITSSPPSRYSVPDMKDQRTWTFSRSTVRRRMDSSFLWARISFLSSIMIFLWSLLSSLLCLLLSSRSVCLVFFSAVFICFCSCFSFIPSSFFFLNLQDKLQQNKSGMWWSVFGIFSYCSKYWEFNMICVSYKTNEINKIEMKKYNINTNLIKCSQKLPWNILHVDCWWLINYHSSVFVPISQFTPCLFRKEVIILPFFLLLFLFLFFLQPFLLFPLSYQFYPLRLLLLSLLYYFCTKMSRLVKVNLKRWKIWISIT